MENEGQIVVRLARVERLLDAIAKHIGLDLETVEMSAANPSSQVLTYIREGQLIQAIAAYRNETGVGLREAKDAVEEIKRGMQRR
ncbi:MAG: hypothetical protein V4671_11275 [Armatimonadota bacterium]